MHFQCYAVSHLMSENQTVAYCLCFRGTLILLQLWVTLLETSCMSLSLYVCNSSSRTICFLFLYGPQFGNDCMFEMVERKIKSICDMRILHKIQISVSPNKVLSEHKHTHSGPCCLELLSKHSSRVEELCRRAAGPLSHRYLVFGPLQKRSAESSFILYT